MRAAGPIDLFVNENKTCKGKTGYIVIVINGGMIMLINQIFNFIYQLKNPVRLKEVLYIIRYLII